MKHAINKTNRFIQVLRQTALEMSYYDKRRATTKTVQPGIQEQSKQVLLNFDQFEVSSVILRKNLLR